MRMAANRAEIDVTVIEDFKILAGHVLACNKRGTKSAFHTFMLDGNRKICNVRNNYHNRSFLM